MQIQDADDLAYLDKVTRIAMCETFPAIPFTW